MRNNDNVNSYTDLNEHSFLRPPHVLVRADDIEYREIITEADLYAAGVNRRVLYEDADGNKFYQEFVPYVHPSGAASLTIGSIAYASDGTATYTPSAEGRMIDETGVLVPTTSLAKDVAGMLLTDYFTHFNDNLHQREHFRVVEIKEGDFLWLLRRGKCELDMTGAVTAGKDVVVSESVAGEAEQATDISFANVAAIADTLPEHLTGDASPGVGLCIGTALETIGGAGLCSVDLKLPSRHVR